MEFNVRPHTILLTLAGSRLYGIESPTSDVDVKGIAIAPPKYYFGFSHKYEQTDSKEEIGSFLDLLSAEEQKICAEQKLEGSVYEIRKFFALAADNNPSMLEVLFAPERSIRKITKQGEKILENRDAFLSSRSRFTYQGYAISQVKRIDTHRGWLKNPPTHRPTREEFGLADLTPLENDQLNALSSVLKKKVDSWEPDLTSITSDGERIQLLERLNEILQDILQSDNKWTRAAKSINADEHFLLLIEKERKFTAATNHWKQYEKWKKDRNKERAELEAKWGFDCYSCDTEFLTNSGWKKFDTISAQDKLATVYTGESNTLRKYGEVEYQHYTEKFSGTFTGNMYHFYGHHTDIMVTPNHKMYIKPVGMNSGTHFPWRLQDAAQMPGHFEILRSLPHAKLRNWKDNIPVENLNTTKEDYLALMGWFLSDGALTFRNEKARSINISQEKNGKLHKKMTMFQRNYPNISSIYEYTRKPNEFNPREHTEIILSVSDKNIVNSFHQFCGRTKEKRIPRWVFDLGTKSLEILYDNMMLGDGTIRTTNFKSGIYYSSLEGLADDVHELAFLCGWETSKWGPYKSINKAFECDMWQIHVNKNANHTRRLTRTTNIETIPTTNHNIICFSVPNGILVTRRHGRIAIQGNCKHAAHTVRLTRQCKEILTAGKVNVDRRNIDGDELKAIRNGAWTYEQLREWFDKEDNEIKEIYDKQTYVVPKTPNMNLLNKVCEDILSDTFAQ